MNLENAKAQRNSRLMELKAQYEAELKQYGVTVEEQYYQYENRDITAPYDGIVKELYVDKEGAVVAAAQVVAEIVPERQDLVVEAEIQNTDIGFVEPGQEADIKIDTYNYQKYGRLQGKVAYISPDAIENERGEQTYRAEIAVAGDSLPGTELSSGMQCSVEVKTDRRRVIAFFLEPLADALDHSLKVRQGSIAERRIL